MEFTYVREDIDGKVVLHFTGTLAQENIEQVGAELTPMIQALGPVKLVLDMMGCTYINSRTVAHIAMWKTNMVAQGGDLILMAMQPQVADVIHVVGLDQVISVVQVIDEIQ